MPTRFENMTLPEVHVRTASEGPVQRGKPLYFNRPWSQLHDEMVDAEVKRIGDLPESRIQRLERDQKVRVGDRRHLAARM